jgi:hypothetical protein
MMTNKDCNAAHQPHIGAICRTNASTDVDTRYIERCNGSKKMTISM